MKHTELTLDKLYNQKIGLTEFCFEVYKKIYSLETITHEESVTKSQFDYCKRKNYFIILILYNNKGQVFLKRNVQDKLYWEIVGRGIEANESMFEVIESLAHSLSSNVLISDVEPIAFIKNSFTYKTNNHIHNGLAFAARVRNSDALNDSKVKGLFVDYSASEIERINRLVNRKVVDFFYSRYKYIFELNTLDFQDNEINTNEKYKNRYIIHNNIMKKVLLTDKRKKKKEFRNLVYNYIADSKSVLDISCGDDDFILQMGRDFPGKFDYIVGNDISWSQIETINKRNDNNRIIFTNHNAVFCPFSENAFDVLLCQNTLHHMPNRSYLPQLFKKMLDIAKKIIIIEIEDPDKTGGFPKLLHNLWYMGFLHDAGEAYLNENDFKLLINEAYRDKCYVEFSSFRNIQGNYHFAIITKKNDVVLNTRQDNTLQQIQDKYILKSNIEDFLKRVNSLGFSFIKNNVEIDTYFCDIHGEFISNRVCLRTRDNESESIQVLYKDDPYKDNKYVITAGVDFELNSNYYNNFTNFLEKLNYHKYCTIEKNRAEYGFYEKDYAFKISIDNFDSKHFVEFMVLTKANRTRDDLISYLDNLLKKFDGLEFTRFNFTYRDYYAKLLYNIILPAKGLKALLIDLDGTVIPSEKVFFDTWSYICEKYYHCTFSLEEYINYELKMDHKLIDTLKLSERLNADVDENEMMDRVYSEYNKAFRKMLNSHDSSPELIILKELKNKGIKIALVTTSRKEYVDMFLSVYKQYADVFDICITRFDVENRKPHGDAYELAAKNIMIDPNECLVIEDSPKGIKAAKEAKMKVVAVKQHTIIQLDKNEFNVPIFDSFSEIVLIINRHLGGITNG